MSQLTRDMTQGNPLKQVILFALPIFLGLVFQDIYVLTDTMLASYALGDNALAAVGASASITQLLMHFANGMNNGYGIIIARYFGSGKKEDIRRAVGTMFSLCIIISVVLTGLGLLLCRPLLDLLKTPADIYPMTYEYIVIIIGGLTTTVAYNMCAGFMRSVGNSRIPLYFLMFSCVLNIGLDYLFLFVFRTGVWGAAAATVIAQGVSALLSLIYILVKYRDYMPGKGDFKLHPGIFKDMLATGLSVAMMLCVFQIGTLVLQRGINSLGTTVISAHTSSRRIEVFLMLPISVLADANSTFVSQNYGAKRLDRIYSNIRSICLIQAGFSVLMVAVAWLLGPSLMKLITGSQDPEIIRLGTLNLRISTAFFVPLGILLTIRLALQSMRHKIAPIVSSGVELLGKVVGFALLIPLYGYVGAAFAEPMTWLLCGIYVTTLFLIYKKRGLFEREIER